MKSEFQEEKKEVVITSAQREQRRTKENRETEGLKALVHNDKHQQATVISRSGELQLAVANPERWYNRHKRSNNNERREKI